jgi:hypothetical protein
MRHPKLRSIIDNENENDEKNDEDGDPNNLLFELQFRTIGRIQELLFLEGASYRVPED